MMLTTFSINLTYQGSTHDHVFFARPDHPDIPYYSLDTSLWDSLGQPLDITVQITPLAA